MHTKNSPTYAFILLFLFFTAIALPANPLDKFNSNNYIIIMESNKKSSNDNTASISVVENKLKIELENHGLFNSSEKEYQILFKFKQETSIDDDGYIFNKISGYAISNEGSILANLTHVSVSLPQTDQPAHLYKILKKMTLDLASRSHINTRKDAIVLNHSTEPTASTNRKLIQYPDEIPHIKSTMIKYKPDLPNQVRLAIAAHRMERIMMDVVIDPQGIPVTASLIIGRSEVNKAVIMSAMTYTLKWRFEPITINGHPQWVHCFLSFN